MTARENALRILRFDQPEHIVSDVPAHIMGYYGCNHEGFAGGGHDVPVGTSWMDIWGTVWEKELTDVMGFPRGNPLDSPEKLRDYHWPDPNDERICAQIREQAAQHPGGDLFLAGSHRDTLWEKSYMLVGMENMMIYFQEEPEFAREVLHRIMDFQLGIAAHYLALGVELVFLGDDLGTQQGPLLSPRIVEEFLVPEYTRLFKRYKENGVLISFHSCGKIDWMLETFMRLGVDVLNPVQATANDLCLLREMTQGRMALFGGVSTSIIMDGPPERITAEVRRCMWELGRSGGYFCAPDQGMPFPEAHIRAFHDAVERYGKYPLLPPGK